MMKSMNTMMLGAVMLLCVTTGAVSNQASQRAALRRGESSTERVMRRLLEGEGQNIRRRLPSRTPAGGHSYKFQVGDIVKVMVRTNNSAPYQRSCYITCQNKGGVNPTYGIKGCSGNFQKREVKENDIVRSFFAIGDEVLYSPKNRRKGANGRRCKITKVNDRDRFQGNIPTYNMTPLDSVLAATGIK